MFSPVPPKWPPALTKFPRAASNPAGRNDTTGQPVHLRGAPRRSRRVSCRARGEANRARAQGVRPPRPAHRVSPARRDQAGDFRPHLAGDGRDRQRPDAGRRAAPQGARRRCPRRAVHRDRADPRLPVASRTRRGRRGGFPARCKAASWPGRPHDGVCRRRDRRGGRPHRVRGVAPPGCGPLGAGRADPDVVAAAHRVPRARRLSDAVSGRAAHRVRLERERRVRDPRARHERRRGRAPGDSRPAAERAACVVARRRAHRLSFAPARRHLGRSGAGRRAAEGQRVRLAPRVVPRRPASGVPVRSMHRRRTLRVQREHPVRNLGRRSRWRPRPRVDDNGPADRRTWFAVVVSERPRHCVRRVRRRRARALDRAGRRRRAHSRGPDGRCLRPGVLA